MFCTNCGHKLPENARFCNMCGFVVSESHSADIGIAVEQNSKDTVPKNRKEYHRSLRLITSVAVALAIIFLGVRFFTLFRQNYDTFTDYTNANENNDIEIVPVSGTEFYSSTAIPSVDWTISIIGKDYNQYAQENGIRPAGNATEEFLMKYYGLSYGDGIEWIRTGGYRGYEVLGVRNGYIVAYGTTYSASDKLQARDILPLELLDVTPYYADSGFRDPWLVWKCKNAYCAVNTYSWTIQDSIYDFYMYAIVLAEDDGFFHIPECERYEGK